jgi:acyl carrier protein
MDEIRKYITDLILDIGIEDDLIKDDAFIREDIGLDSTEVVDISLAIKKKYNVTLDLKGDMKLEEIYSNIKNNIK